MELSILKLREPVSGRPMGERRRRIRHKLHSPVYASFNGPSAGMVLDLSELLDLSEDGFSVQTSERLEVNQTIRLSLDLPETKSYIHGSGQIAWSNGAGRAGIRFSELPEQSQRILKEWLLVNLWIACTRRAGHAAARAEKKPPALPSIVSTPAPVEVPEIAGRKIGVPDLSEMQSAVEAVRREVQTADDDFETTLHRITEHALALTGASGAALAFLTDDKMVCRAAAGEPALPLGTVVDIKQGLTGECVRSGKMIACEDTETDERVDREICRILGIRSILAAPIFSDFRVVGLLEVFSPIPRAFTTAHEKALDRHVDLIPKAQPAVPPARVTDTKLLEPLPPEPSAAAHTAPVIDPAIDKMIDPVREAVWEPEAVTQEPLKGVPVRLGHILLLALTAAVLALASGYLLAPKIEKLWLSKAASTSGPATAQASGAQSGASSITRSTTFDELRKLAESGDPDAQYGMGFRYRNGEGVPQDDAQAAKWYERAADQGYLNAQNAMGAAYWAGRGVPKDLSKSYFWSVLAANQGDESSAARMQGLALQMTPAQVASAQSQADNWMLQHRAAK